MAEFVQIGDYAFNPALITRIQFFDNDHGKRVVIWFSVDDYELEFTGDDYQLFLRWWERKAEVYKVV